jgi:serine/threonine protein kinase
MHEASCPEPELLQGLLEDRLPEELQRDLESHLSLCARCQAALEQIAEGAAEQPVREACLVRCGEAAAIEPVLQRLIINLKDLVGVPSASPSAELEPPLLDEFRPEPDETHDLRRLGPYDILGVLSRGASKLVLKASDREQQRLLAIKVFRFPDVDRVQIRRNFLRYVRAAALVQHPRLVPILGIKATEDFAYCLLQYVPGPSLQERLDREGPLELPEILRIGEQVASALAAAHDQGLHHQALAPSKVLLMNGSRQVQLLGLGQVSAHFEPHRLLESSAPVKLHYLSPEQVRYEPFDCRSDLFSLGSLLYAMCTGRPPYYRGSVAAVIQQIRNGPPHPIPELNPEIPVWLVKIIEELHCLNPAERIQTAAEVAKLLRIGLGQIAADDAEVDGHTGQPASGSSDALEAAPQGKRWLARLTYFLSGLRKAGR